VAAALEGRSRELLEERNFSAVATIAADGSPHVAVAWVHPEGDEVWLNSAEGRIWPENLRRDPRVTLTVANLDNPYEYVSIKGHVIEMTPEGADDHIDKLAKKYLDKDTYPFRKDGEVRLIVKVRPEKVMLRGG
jgi:PPOX class probable F420-dependent enzyme